MLFIRTAKISQRPCSLLFVLYTADLRGIFKLFWVSSRQFSDDIQTLPQGLAPSAVQENKLETTATIL